jgi:hypothetical protein
MLSYFSHSMFYHSHYKKYCILPGAEALVKCKKPWQLDVCQGFCQEQNHQQICSSQIVLPGVQLLAKCALGIGPGSTPGKLCLLNCRLLWHNADFCRLCQHHISHFQNMPGTLRGVNPWQIVYDFFLNVNKIFKINVFKLFFLFPFLKIVLIIKIILNKNYFKCYTFLGIMLCYIFKYDKCKHIDLTWNNEIQSQ